MDKFFFKRLKESIRPFFDEAGGHGLDHTERVYKYALIIAKQEKCDVLIVKTAALLHDVARKAQENIKLKICHAEFGADLAMRILEKTDFPKDKIQDVCHAIYVHRKSKKLKPLTKEAEIIQDADRLDAIGILAIIRMFEFPLVKKTPVFEREFPSNNKNISILKYINEKMLKLNPESFNTNRGKSLAREKYDFVKLFVERLKKEMKEV